jgi:hypothetical protein
MGIIEPRDGATQPAGPTRKGSRVWDALFGAYCPSFRMRRGMTMKK